MAPITPTARSCAQELRGAVWGAAADFTKGLWSAASGKDLVLELEPSALAALGGQEIQDARRGQFQQRLVVVKYNDPGRRRAGGGTRGRDEYGLFRLLIVGAVGR